ncbi:hypothetical protein C8J57DRAFT_1317274 [Mycena rebaudengoi]|nr:hypothetical protein C8J57DRAFT_1317274 [Mycena rebaudengoi]
MDRSQEGWKFHNGFFHLCDIAQEYADCNMHTVDQYDAADIMSRPCGISPATETLLRLLWDIPDLQESHVKAYLVNSLAEETLKADAERLYTKIRTAIFGTGPLPVTTVVISILFRLLCYELDCWTKSLQLETKSLTIRANNIDSSRFIPAFTFYLKLEKGPGNYGPYDHFVGRYMKWLQPCDRKISFLFFAGHWSTLAKFREVIDAVLGRHVITDLPPLVIYRDAERNIVANDRDRLSGDYYISLRCDQLTGRASHICRTQSGAPERQSQFPQAVRERCRRLCVATQLPSESCDAAHILPRSAYQVFSDLAARFCPNSNLQDVDDPRNGILIWVALHRLWDKHRLGFLGRIRWALYFAETMFPLSQFQGTSLDQPAINTAYGETGTLMGLRQTITLIEWFGCSDFNDFLSVLAEEKDTNVSEALEDVEMVDSNVATPTEHTAGRAPTSTNFGGSSVVSAPTTTSTRIESGSSVVTAPTTTISPSTSNSSTSPAGGTTFSVSSSNVSASTAPTDISTGSNLEKTADLRDLLAEAGEEEADEEEEEMEADGEDEDVFAHWAGCPCVVEDPTVDGPCIKPLLGLVQLWESLYPTDRRNAV